MDITTILICGIIIAIIASLAEWSKMKMERQIAILTYKNAKKDKQIADIAMHGADVLNVCNALLEVLDENFEEDEVEAMLEKKFEEKGLDFYGKE